METVKDRLMQFLRAERITNSEFCRRMGLSMAYLASMRKSMPEEKIMRLMELFPMLNRDWLLYGEGEMYRDPEAEEKAIDMEQYVVPLLPVEAYAGRFSMYSEGVDERRCEKIVSPVKGADFAIRVTGDSMEPRIHDGTLLFIRRINDRSFIPWGHPLVLDTENGTLLKLLYPGKNPDEYLEAMSYNEKYPALKVPTESIYGIYRVLAQVREAQML